MQRIWALLLAVCMVLSCLPVTVFAETDSGASSSSVSTGTTSTGTTETGTTETDTTETGSTESGTGATDSTAGTAYGQDTGICTTCNGTYINGICSNADCTAPYQAPEGEGTTEKPYLIANAGNLFWFAAKVNGGSTSISAKLTKNITVNSGVLKEDGSLNSGDFRAWTPIENGYNGTFNGDGHTISGLYFNDSTANYVGLFGYVGENGTVKNIAVKDSYIGGNYQVGGIAGSNDGTITNCCNTGTVTATGEFEPSVGGIAGSNDGTITNCYNTGMVTATCNSEYSIADAGGIAGSNYGTITNCYNTGNVTATADGDYASAYSGGLVGFTYVDPDSENTLKIENCYYLDSSADDGIGRFYGERPTVNGGAESAAAFASGEVAYWLNGGHTGDDVVWKQTLGTDKIPNFTSTQIVYAYTNCVGTTLYTNDSTQESGVHDYNDNGICKTDSTHYQPAELKDGVYEIANAGNLYWFADFVNQGGDNLKANAKLTADIDLENRAWTAIGTAEKPYTGTFDGGNFTISNFSLTVTEGNNQGFFGAVSGGTAKNFTIRGDINITATIDISDVSNIQSFSNVGGVVGYATSKALIENVTSYVNITDSHTPVTYTDAEGNGQSIRVSGIGGIVGYMDGSTAKGCTYDGTITSVCGASIAGIVGNASNSSTVDLCTNKGNVSAENNSAHIGGIAGDAQTGTTISYCLNYGNITSSGGDCIGGIVAYANQNVKIEYCGNIGMVTCTADGDGFIGGILGYINNRNFAGISNCFNYGAIVTNEGKTAHAGAILGYNRNSGNASYSNNYYLDASFEKAVSDNAISDVYSMTAEQFTLGEVAYKLNGNTNAGVWKQTLGEGGDSYPNFTGKDVYYGYANCTATEQSYTNEPYTTSGHHYDNGICKRCDGYEEPTLNSDGYYEIDNAGKLYWFAAKVNGGSGTASINGKLTDNITVNASVLTDGKLPADTSALRQWTPIGNDTVDYTGSFDGQNHTISGLFYSGSDGYVGLFGCFSNGATVQNVGVIDSCFQVSGEYAYLGGIVGFVYAHAYVSTDPVTISGCSSAALLAATAKNACVGGMIGAFDLIDGSATIQNCSNTGDITATSTSGYSCSYCGGMIGGLALDNGSVTVQNCSNTGELTVTVASGYSYSGGMAGHVDTCNNGSVTIQNCFNTGDLTATSTSGESYCGGVAGYVSVYDDAGGQAKVTLSNCYYTAEKDCGGIDVSGDGAKVTADKVETKTAEQFKSGEVTYLLNGMSTAEDVVWKQTIDGTSLPGFSGGIVYYGYASCTATEQSYINEPYTTQGHPYDENGFCTRCGGYQAPTLNSDGYYEIADAGNLFWLAAKVNGGETSINAKLTADIDLESREWTPIGNMENPYIGTFDGTKYDESGENAIGNYAISGLYVEGNDDRTGLFGLVGEGGTVKNVTVKDAYIEGDQYVGGVVGQNHGGTITNCTVSGTVTGSESVGGVVGENRGTITNCTNTATVTGTGDNVGGVVGSNYSGEITNCTVSGTVSGTGENVGGVVGYDNFGTITNCTNSATVSGTGDNVGGVVGCDDWGSIEGCANTGTITGSSSVGGVVGSNKNSGTITGNYNTGRVTGTGDNVGGVAGYSDLEIKNCYNTGVVGGSSYVGGVVGYCNATIANCYNTGKVTGSNYVGGIAGKIENGGCWYCCYLTGTANKAVGEGDGDGAYAMTADEFKSGAATWLLNEEFAGEDVVWKQTLGTDDYPGYSGGIVYGGYAQQCVETRSYTNDSEAANDLKPYPHDYYEHENGICTRCGAYAPCMGKGTAEAPYQIINIGNLYWFAAKVNGGETGIHAELWADITINPGTFDQDGKYTPGEDEAAGTTPRAWTPIGNSTYPYTGIFNGNGHTISGLYYPGEKYDYNAGLFGNVGEGGTVKNVAVTGSYIRGYYAGGVVCSNSGTITGCSYSGTVIGTSGSTGGVAGRNSGTITNCYNTGTVSGKSNVGGVAGFNNGAITNCYNTGAVSGTDKLVGGVVGYHYAGNVTNCYNTGTSGAGSVAGGNNATITNCYYLKGTACIGTEYGDSNVTNVEAMTAADFASGKVTWLLNGKTSEGTTESPLVWKQTLSGEDKQGLPSLEGDIVYGGYIKCDEKGKFSNDADEVTGAQTEVSAHQFNDDGFCKDCDAYQPCEGEGTDSEPYKIANAGNLYWFAAQVNSGKTDIRANLTADITVNSNVLKSDGSLNTGTFRAWTPIGSESNKFTGTFDGTKYDEDQYGMLIMVGNYTISGLYFNDTSKDYVGLFGYVGYGGIVEEVVIKDSYFKGKQYVGGVAGYSEDQIYYCSNSGTVSGTYNVGGVAGAIGGINGMIRFCSNSGAVSGAARVGGVVGRNQNSGRVWDCYNTGAVSGTSDIGGVAGCNEGEISDCYNNGTVTGTVDGDVTGTASIGGVVGSNSSSILNCYNSGTISGDGAYNIGGVVGHNYEGGSISNCYYLTDCATDGNGTVQYGIGNATMGSTTADTDDVTTGKTKAQFATGEVAWRLNGNGGAWGQDIGKDDYPCFSSPIVYRYTDCQGNDRFSQIPSGSGDHYCDADGFCIAKKPDGTLCGAYQPCEGDESGGYYIKNIGNLYWFAEQVNNGKPYINGYLVKDITVNENVLKSDGTLNTGTFRVWTPIGNESNRYCGYFYGMEKFDENGESLGFCTISGLYVKSTDPSNSYVGLFGYAEGATIWHINVADSYFEASATGENSNAYVGGIVGYAQGGVQITGCTVSGTFIATADGDCAYAYAGGIVGDAYASGNVLDIANCTSSGTVTAEANGVSDSGDSYAIAYAGGIVGYAFVSGNTLGINSCTSSCTVTAEAHGGHSADANFFSEAFSGGLVGCAYAGLDGTLRIERCYNTGAVTATADGNVGYSAYSGGLVGYADAAGFAQNLNIECCYSTGAVTATVDGDVSYAYSGGLVGCAFGATDGCLTFRNCYYLDTSAEKAIGYRSGAMTMENVEAKTEAQFKSGEVTWLLNGKSADENVVWKQTLNGTNFPGFTGDIVYGNYTDCKNTEYSNTQVSADPLAHDYENNDGFCKICGAYEPCEGEGTAEKPYLIKNAGNLYWFAQYVNSQNVAGAAGGTASGNAKLTADIIVNADVLKSDGTLNSGDFKAWTPIGTDGNQYAGTFDGDGHTISGLYYNGDDQHVGLFGYIANGANIQNVTVTDSYFDCTKNSLAYVGGLAGYADAQTYTLTIQNCTFRGTIARSGGDGHAGGLVGYLYVTSGEITVKNCSFDGTVSASGSNVYAGGFAGSINMSDSNGKCTIENSYATGDVTALGNNTYAGGLVGHASANGTLTVTNCYATVSVTANASSADAYAGGLVGYARAQGGAITVANCYAIGAVSASTGGATTGEFPAEAVQGGIVGCAKTSTVTLSNCYYQEVEGLQGVGNDAAAAGATAVTEEQFNSGEVAYRLNDGKTGDDVVWKQTLVGAGKMTAPGFTGQIVIYDETGKTYGNAAFVSVTITWTSMEFTYTDGQWNPDTHAYKAGTWSTSGGTVTVENTGTATVTVGLSFASTLSGVSGSFGDGSSFTLAVGGTETATLTLSGKPSTALSKTSLGNITVSIQQKSSE